MTTSYAVSELVNRAFRQYGGRGDCGARVMRYGERKFSGGDHGLMKEGRIKLAPLPRFAVGIDPGSTTGVGVFDRRENRIVAVKRTDFFGVLPWLTANVRLSDAKIFVEVPAKFMYSRHDEKGEGGKIRERRMLMTGEIRRESLLLAETIRREGIDVEEVRPVMQKKWDQYQFQAATKWHGPAGEHERDACRLAMFYANKRKELER